MPLSFVTDDDSHWVYGGGAFFSVPTGGWPTVLGSLDGASYTPTEEPQWFARLNPGHSYTVTINVTTSGQLSGMYLWIANLAESVVVELTVGGNEHVGWSLATTLNPNVPWLIGLRGTTVGESNGDFVGSVVIDSTSGAGGWTVGWG